MSTLIKYVSVIKKCKLFEDIEEKEIFEILKDYQIESYEKDETIRFRNDPCTEVLILIEGETLGLFINEDGKVIQVDHMFAPKTLATAVIFSSNPKFPVDVVTVKPSKILKIPKEKFVRKMMTNEKLLRNYLQLVSDTFVFITDRFYEITLKNLVQKICSYLYELHKAQNSTTVIMNMSKEELAREFGVTRPALSRVFIELEKAGVIEIEGKSIKIKKFKYVKDYALFF
ncbi:Crp/Fnr family transcriptional regulator [Thermosipho atlanticus]|uniref:cAMP-binding domain of CRP or a regulatory subunit of cAMP-dependent protein kinases n=1 Tax=Thermosipho atlanticus DSM 15807 TaxID=1123380 RepID=A0A1M5T1P9_9BACT|nr:Crp/Fnr family transcriptional regulator [Thermosipho atlanticus]SHH44709.1 cAMP-binding domain of CRP or a regulatory subunit of cAMP-dependent protein kinases [Thermosipho atlanticus DSM 15807]